MCPQLVDFNADGIPDIVTGTFEGVAFLVPGSKMGFEEPVRILDSAGNTILLSMFWNNEKKKWDNADRSPKGEKYPEDHCISVVAVDWDNDGDLDLLLGAKEGGLYLRRNDGSPGKPQFVTTNERIKAKGQDFAVPGGLTAPRLIDWNGDGLFDLVCGSFTGGAVYLYLNQGKAGAPVFGEPVTLIPPGSEGGMEPLRPTEGAYVDVVDYDGDGKLDLLVGGYSHWVPPARELTDAEKAELKELEKKLAAIGKEQNEMFAAVEKEAKDDSEKQQKLYQELAKTEKYRRTYAEMRKLTERKLEIQPEPSREAFVWLYRRR